jgi:hypothetical protein
MDLNKMLGVGSDPGSYIRQELEQGLEPITSRVDRLEKKLDLLLLGIDRVEALLKALQPLSKIIAKLPFLR